MNPRETQGPGVLKGDAAPGESTCSPPSRTVNIVSGAEAVLYWLLAPGDHAMPQPPKHTQGVGNEGRGAGSKQKPQQQLLGNVGIQEATCPPRARCSVLCVV